jgi:hypothetical protein
MKLTFKNYKLIIALFILCFAISKSNFAQCRSVVTDGIKKLTPYEYNGQVNSATMEAGQPVEIHLFFFKGGSYKLQLSSDKNLGKVNFRVVDQAEREVYNSTSSDKSEDFWKFFSNSSQELIIQITAVEKTKKGCVAVLVGMQPPKARSESTVKDL